MRGPPILLLLIAAMLAPACGRSEPESGTGANGRAGRPEAGGTSAPGPFRLVVGRRARPGRRPPVSVEGDARGVVLTVRSIPDPASGLPDPKAPPPEDLPTVARASAASGLPPLSGGLYLVEARRGDRAERALLAVSGLLPVVHRSPAEILVFVAEVDAGRAVPGATVAILGAEEPVRGTTDAAGVFRTELPGFAPVRVVAVRGDRVGVAAVPAVADGAGRKMRILTGRTSWRPGETVRFKALLAAGGGDDTRFAATDARGLVLAEGEAHGAGLTAAWGSFRIPPRATPGPGRLTIRTGDLEVSRELEIRGARRDPFRVEVRPAKDRAVKGEEVAVRIRATFAPGLPVAGARVSYRVDVLGARFPCPPPLSGRGRLDERGELSTSFTGAAGGVHRIRVEVVSPEGLGATGEARVRVDPARFALRVRTGMRIATPGDERRVEVRAVLPDGLSFPEAGEVRGELRCGTETVPFVLHPRSSEVFAHLVRLDRPGRVEITARAEDDLGNEILGRDTILVLPDDGGAPPAKEIEVVTDRDEVRPGETVRLLLLRPFTLAGRPVLLTTEGNGLGLHSVEERSGPEALVSLPVPAELGPRMAITAEAVRDGRVFRGRAVIRVARPALRIRIETSPSAPRPGAGAEIRILVHDPREGKEAESLVVVREDPDGEVLLFAPWVRTFGKELSAPLTFRLPPRPASWRVFVLTTAPGGVEASATRVFRAEDPVSLDLAAPSRPRVGDVLVARAALSRAAGGRLELEAEGGLLRMDPGCYELPADGGEGSTVRAVRFSARRPGRAVIRARYAGKCRVEREREITVLPAGPERTLHRAGGFRDGRAVFGIPIPGGTDLRDARLTVLFTAGPAAALAAALSRPVDKATGEPEAAAAALSLTARAGRLFHGGGLALPRALEEAAARSGERRYLVLSTQNADGGWGPWAGAPSEPATSAAVTEHLLGARESGIEIPEAALTRALAYLRKVPSAPGVDPAAAAAALVALARAGERIGPLASRFSDPEARRRAPPLALARLALAFARAGSPGEAAGLLSRLDPEPGGADPVRAAAAAVRARLALGGKSAGERVDRGIAFLLDRRRGAVWASAGETAAAVGALLDLLETRGPGSGSSAGIRIRVGDALAGTGRLTGEDLLSRILRMPIPPAYLRPGPNRVRIEKTGDLPVRYSASATLGAPPGDLAPERHGLGVVREFRALRRAGDRFLPGPATQTVRRGRLLLVTLHVFSESDRPVRDLRIECPLPAGTRPVEGVPGVPPWPSGALAERRPDGIVLHLAGPVRREVRLSLALLALHAGLYHVPPARGSLSGSPSVRGTSSSGILYVE